MKCEKYIFKKLFFKWQNWPNILSKRLYEMQFWEGIGFPLCYASPRALIPNQVSANRCHSSSRAETWVLSICPRISRQKKARHQIITALSNTLTIWNATRQKLTDSFFDSLIRTGAYWFFITTGAHTEGLTFFLYSFLVCGQTDTLVLFRPERNLHMFKEEGTKCIEREHIQRCIIGIDRQWITNFVFSGSLDFFKV